MQTLSPRHSFSRLRTGCPVILPSLLQCDFGNLRDEVERLEAAGVQGFHLDVMDGHFVPNFTYGMPIVEAVRRATQLPLDVHLMTSNPGDYLDQFAAAGADCLTIHCEIEAEKAGLLDRIRNLGLAAGLAINPKTPMEQVEPYLDRCDLLLIMSVEAGFGGQAFNPVALQRLRAMRSVHPDLLLQVDGGINQATIGPCVEAGAQLLVVGSAIFGQDDYPSALQRLAAATGR